MLSKLSTEFSSAWTATARGSEMRLTPQLTRYYSTKQQWKCECCSWITLKKNDPVLNSIQTGLESNSVPGRPFPIRPPEYWRVSCTCSSKLTKEKSQCAPKI